MVIPEKTTWLEAMQRAEEADRLAEVLTSRIGKGAWPEDFTRGAQWAVRQIRAEANTYLAYATTMRRKAQ